MRLLQGLMDIFEELGRRNVNIQAIYARSNQTDGIQLSEHIGFGDLTPAPGVSKRVFHLNIHETENDFLKVYRHALESHSHNMNVDVT